jgi:ArsR family transcriptional regulator
MTRSPEFNEAAQLLKTLSHPMRLKIVCGLLGEPANMSRIGRELDIPTSTLAQHLAVLRRAEVLDEDRHGVEIVFRVADERVPAILRALCSPEESTGRLPAWRWEALRQLGSLARVKR